MYGRALWCFTCWFFWLWKTFGTWNHSSLASFPISQQYTTFHERNGWGSESARWQSTISHWESVTIRQKSGGHGQCEIFYRKSTSEKSRHLSIYWKPKQKLHNSSWTKLFCERESFWYGAHPPNNFVWSETRFFVVHTWTIHLSLTKNSVYSV